MAVQGRPRSEPALLLVEAKEPLLDMAIYHTQQYAEKCLKAFLSFKSKEIDKTHNLLLLNERCIALDNAFSTVDDDLLFLLPFATIYRYPEGDLMPSVEKVTKAIEAAQRVYGFTVTNIVRPGSP